MASWFRHSQRLRELLRRATSLTATAHRSDAAITNSRRFSSSTGPSSSSPTTQQTTTKNFNSSLAYLSLALTAGTGSFLLWQFKKEEDRLVARVRESQGAGKPAIGGPFQLIDQNGNKFTNKDLQGKFSLLYFGFTYCPDICPDELEKIAQVVDTVEKQTKSWVQPVFITIDPERDTVQQVKEYVKEFHPRLIGLTGTLDQTKFTARQYRVYYSKTNDEGDDYLVDHSIITYLINPDGEFVTFYGKNTEADVMASNIEEHLKNWRLKEEEKEGKKA
jgi:protein SCO1